MKNIAKHCTVLTNHNHTDQSYNKKEQRIFTIKGATHSTEVEEGGYPDTEAGTTIVPMVDGNLGTTSIVVQYGDIDRAIVFEGIT
jgi:hypothetical protein